MTHTNEVAPENPPPVAATTTESATPGFRVTKKEARRGTLLALLAWVLAVYDLNLFGIILPDVRRSMGWSEATATGLVTAISVGTAIVVLAVGPMVDRIGRRRGMMATVGGTAVASGLTALTFSPIYLVIVRSIGGLGLSEQSINATYLNEIYAATDDEKIKRNRGFAYSIVQSGWPLGTLLATGFAAIFLPLVGWRGVFLLATLPALILFFMRRSLKETPQYRVLETARRLEREGRKTESDKLLGEYSLHHDHGTPLSAIFRKKFRRNTICLSLVWFFNFFGVTTFTALGTTLLTDGKGLPLSLSLLIFMIANAGGFFGYLTFGWLGQRYGRREMAGYGFIIAAAVFAIMVLWADTTVSIIILYALGQFFMAGPFAALMFFMGESYTTDCRATGTTFLNAMGQPGAIVAGAIITAILASGGDWTLAAISVGAVGVFVSGVAMLACKKMPELADFGRNQGGDR